MIGIMIALCQKSNTVKPNIHFVYNHKELKTEDFETIKYCGVSLKVKTRFTVARNRSKLELREDEVVIIDEFDAVVLDKSIIFCPKE